VLVTEAQSSLDRFIAVEVQSRLVEKEQVIVLHVIHTTVCYLLNYETMENMIVVILLFCNNYGP